MRAIGGLQRWLSSTTPGPTNGALVAVGLVPGMEGITEEYYVGGELDSKFAISDRCVTLYMEDCGVGFV
jgi:hypothetical protein